MLRVGGNSVPKPMASWHQFLTVILRISLKYRHGRDVIESVVVATIFKFDAIFQISCIFIESASWEVTSREVTSGVAFLNSSPFFKFRLHFSNISPFSNRHHISNFAPIFKFAAVLRHFEFRVGIEYATR